MRSCTILFVSRDVRVARVYFEKIYKSFWHAGWIALFFVSCAAPSPKNLKETQLQDSYLWLEEVEGRQALEFARTHNERTLSRLTKDPLYKALEKESRTILLAEDRIPWPSVRNGWAYNFWQDDQHVRGVWRRVRVDDYQKDKIRWETILDLDELAQREKENWVFQGASCLPPLHRRCLLTLSRGGKDASVVREFDVEEKRFIPASQGGFELPEAKSHVGWADEDHVWVGTDYGPGSLTRSGYPRIIKLWRRGTALSEAQTVFEGDESDVRVNAWTAFRPEGAVSLISRHPTFFTSIYYRYVQGKLLPIPLPENAEVQEIFQGKLLFTLRKDWKRGGKNYPRGVLLELDLDSEKATPRVVFDPGNRGAIQSVSSTRNSVLVNALWDVQGRLFELRPKPKSGYIKTTVRLPSGGVIHLTSANPYEEDSWIQHEGFFESPALFLKKGFKKNESKPKKIKSLPERFDAQGMKWTQNFVKSRDGTKIPYFLLTPKNWKPTGKSPTLLYGYGGFEVPLTPSYVQVLGKSWISRGGVYVLANIRGGGEYGPRWHEGVLKLNRHKVFEDFEAIARDLVQKKIASPETLGIMGGSNGGLLMGVMMTRNPELFSAVVCQVPLLDMLRYTELLAGHSWIGEYGDPGILEERQALERYSPYQNIKKGERYPEVFFLTSTKDDRVHPGHARKMVARLEELGYPVLYFENIEGGHSAAANIEQRVKRQALEFTYLFQKLSPKN